MTGLEIRVRGRVQGVGFRPTVWRYARELGLAGSVHNDGEGVLIRAGGPADALARFIARITDEPPPLARVEQVETRDYDGALAPAFEIVASAATAIDTQIAPDAATCAACAAEVADPFERRYRYPFATCTHCGPRLTIVTALPYDRAQTTLADFPLCPACDAQYRDPADRRFHAETIACHACGPRARLIRLDGRATSFDQHSMLDDVDAAYGLITKGEIVALKGLGGYHLACDATRADAVARLRAGKQRDAKPFAIMARDLDQLRRYCAIDAVEAAQLTSPEAPIVLLRAIGPERVAEAVAPGLATLGAMLPTTPLHLLIARRCARPLVMTSANLSDEPQITRDDDLGRLAGFVSYALIHDRSIANRVDDSVVQVALGVPRVLRRARGFAPAPLALPPGFEAAPPLVALGGDLKATFCLVRRGAAVLSQHQGDLAEPTTLDDYARALRLYTGMLDHAPVACAVDRHPGYHARRLASAPLIEVQHHHAHVAACLAEHGRPRTAPRVLGVVMDGLGYGDDGALWGGEFLHADYVDSQRVATLKPVALLGGDQAAREPWRNLYAHLTAELGWPAFAASFADLDVYARLAAKPRATLDAMRARGLNAPLASSCGRLFDAVAAALGIAFDAQAYEGEAAIRLEAAVDPAALAEPDDLIYPLAIPRLPGGLPYLEPLAMWSALLGDLVLATPVGVIAARFHRALARGIAMMVAKLRADHPFDTVALSGGCFQNRVLLAACVARLEAQGLHVLTHARVPANDGGLSLGQAAIAAARLLQGGV